MNARNALLARQDDFQNNGKVSRGHYLTLEQVAENYPVFTLRLLRRLVDERRIAFTRAGRRIVLSESDIETYLERNRVEPLTFAESSRVVSAQAMPRVAS